MSDLDVIRELEQILDRKLFEKPFNLNGLRNRKAYSLDRQGRVIHVGLEACGLQSLDTITPLLGLLTNLQSLYLGWNPINDISQLRDLKNLQILSLERNPLRDFSVLEDFSNLQNLYLTNNQITDASFLASLTGLQTLALTNNQITDTSFLQSLSGLQHLYLSWNKIDSIPYLKDLADLRTLYLSSNPVGDCSFLQDAVGLQHVDLRSNNISDIFFLQYLKQAVTIRLGNNHIADISPLQKLAKVEFLDISENQISEIASLQECSRIQSLYLGWNPIGDLSCLQAFRELQTLQLGYNISTDWSFLSKLSRLENLILREERISNLSFLTEITQLQSLDVRAEYIGNLTALQELKQLKTVVLSPISSSQLFVLEELQQLQCLTLRSSKIKELGFLKNYRQLINLDLRSNQICNIFTLRNLEQLQFLDLSENEISDVSVLKHLPSLQHCILSNNKITHLPHWLTRIGLGITENAASRHGDLVIYDNLLETPPPEIAQQGKAAIRAYFRSLKDSEMVDLNEIKVLIVGEGKAGKTSLLKQIQGLDFNTDESQTHGINVVTVPADRIPGLDQHSDLAECQLHCWDFGGQEIMHASHQFFLSQRALYILVVDSRNDERKYHWLNHIQKFGGDSPRIVAVNKIDLNPNYNIERKQINDRYPATRNRFIHISCQTGEGLPGLVAQIAAAIPDTSLYGTAISAAWMRVKEQLVAETTEQRYISRDRFYEICQAHGVTDLDQQRTLLQYLHDLGIVLYFRRLTLANIYVLDPHWVTIGVYKIINSGRIRAGLLYEEDLDYILNEEEIKRGEYDPAREKNILYTLEEQRYILSIMQQFELCYSYRQQEGSYIVPNLLPKELAGDEPDLDQGAPLRFVMRYDFLPASILPRVMLRLRNDIEQRQQWRYGMVLRNSSTGCRAKIKADEERRTLTITVQGDEGRKREYFSVIRHTIADISADFENLVVEELIPLPGYPDKFVSYPALLGHERVGRDEYFDGELVQFFSVAEMLDGVVSAAQRAGDISRLAQLAREGKGGNVSFNNYYGPVDHSGDTTTVGNIEHSQDIAMGTGASATRNENA